jgi:hypothetical protein
MCGIIFSITVFASDTAYILQNGRIMRAVTNITPMYDLPESLDLASEQVTAIGQAQDRNKKGVITLYGENNFKPHRFLGFFGAKNFRQKNTYSLPEMTLLEKNTEILSNWVPWSLVVIMIFLLLSLININFIGVVWAGTVLTLVLGLLYFIFWKGSWVDAFLVPIIIFLLAIIVTLRAQQLKKHNNETLAIT